MKEEKDDGEKRKGKSREQLQKEREKRQEDRNKKHRKAKKAAAKAAKGTYCGNAKPQIFLGEISEHVEETLAMPGVPIVHEFTETLSLNLPEISSIVINQSEPQNIIRLSPELVTAANLDVALKLVEQKARSFQPQDDRVVGQVDMIKAALSVPLFNELVPAIKVSFEE